MFSINKSLLCTFIILSCLNFYQTTGLRILGIFPYQGKSHFIFGHEIIKALAFKGHQVDVYSHFPLKIAIPNYTTFSLNGSVHTYVNNLSYDRLKHLSSTKMLIDILCTTGKPLCKLLEHPYFQKLLHDPPTDPPYDLIIHGVGMEYCHIAWGRYLKVPIVGIVSIPVMDWLFDSMGNPFNVATDMGFISYVPPLSFFERLSNLINYFQVKYTFKYLVTQYHEEYVKKHFGSDYPSATDLPKDYSLLLANYDPILQGVRPFVPSIVPISGLHIIDRNETLPQNVQQWLDESNHGFIYVSFGSLLKLESFPLSTLEAINKTFENIAPIRVLLKISNQQEVLRNLPANVLTQSWLPQLQILKHKKIKVFVTHCGTMGTQESIYYGVPMVCCPIFMDQLQNADVYARKKIAVKLNIDEITSESLTNAITELLKNPEYRNSIQKISYQFKDRPMSQLDTAVYWIEFIARHGKDALRTPSLDMPWWQVNLLDVYGFIAAVTLLAVYFATTLIKKCIKLFQMKGGAHLKLKTK